MLHDTQDQTAGGSWVGVYYPCVGEVIMVSMHALSPSSVAWSQNLSGGRLWLLLRLWTVLQSGKPPC